MPVITETTSLGGATVHVDHENENYHFELRGPTFDEHNELDAFLRKYEIWPLSTNECPPDKLDDGLRVWCYYHGDELAA